jgi:hypothetical protein
VEELTHFLVRFTARVQRLLAQSLHSRFPAA